ncbi:MAG: hypothetical protein QG650_758 [Patescibacteria group bacterium]|nr:hypothetical protein [Patescibacteria group bacterium]
MSSKPEILRKIEDLFYRKSFSDLSMDEIADALGMKKASLYYHFPSKEAMFLEILADSFERHRASVVENLSRGPAELTRNLVESASENRNLFSVASQKGYCKIDSVRDEIARMKTELGDECATLLEKRFGWSPTRSALFFSLIDALAQKRCGGGCDDPLPEGVVCETVALFFENDPA